MNLTSRILFLQTCAHFTNALTGCKMIISSESLTMVLDSNLCNPIELLSTVENSSTIKTINMSGLGLTNSDFLKNPRIFVEKFSNLVTQRCKKTLILSFIISKHTNFILWLVWPISSLKQTLESLQLFMQIRKSEDTRLQK